MSTFESKVTLHKPVSIIFAFLSDMNNHKQLMPENIIDWQSNTDVASFNIPNITKLSLKVQDRVTNSLVRIIQAETTPFDMELRWALRDLNGATEITLSIEAHLNMMMKMMASGPLQKLADEETANLLKLLS